MEGHKSQDAGLREIENAKWEKVDDYFVLEVEDYHAMPVRCYLEKRPPYCDRGHISLKIDGHLDLDYADSFPRYFFSFKEADSHTRAFLKWRLWKKRHSKTW